MKITFTKNWSLIVIMLVFGAMTLNAQTVIHHEEFNGGIPGTWTVNPISSNDPDSTANAVWVWTDDGILDNGAFWGAGTAIGSPSISNGAVAFNSDFLDNNGDANTQGGGAAPGPQVSELISPIIDCSAYTSLAVKFNQHFRNFQASPRVEVSADGGTTWTAYPMNSGTAANNSIDPNTVTIIDVTSFAGGSSQVQVKFVWDGNYYFWMIDDFELITLPNNNLSVGETYVYFPARHMTTPATHADFDSMFFAVDVANIGAVGQPNTWIKAEITDDLSNVVYADSLNLGMVAPGTIDTLEIGTGWLPTGLMTGIYTVSYSTWSDSTDFDANDNIASRNFSISDLTFAKEAGTTGALQPGGGGDYEVAAYYNLSPNYTGGDYYATTATFSAAKNAADGPLMGDQVTIFLYEAPNLDSLANSGTTLTTTDHLNIIGSADYTFGSEANFDDVTVTLVDFNTGQNGVKLRPGGHYVLSASYTGGSNVIFHGFSSNVVDYFQISTIINSSQWFLGGFGPEDAVHMRMGLDFVSPTVEVELPESVLNVYPNPANEFTTFQLDFDAPINTLVTVMDVSGKVLFARDYNNVTSEKITYNTADLAAGTYIVRVSTKEGVRNQRFVVTH